jgi:quercetin dioxygenase-like cupin family protein
VHVIRADEGRRVASSERANSAVGRVVYADEAKGLEVYEYITDRTEDLDVWYEHEGDKVLLLIGGRLTVEFEGRPPQSLGPGDCLVHTGAIAHRWRVEGDEQVRLFLVITNRAALGSRHR